MSFLIHKMSIGVDEERMYDSRTIGLFSLSPSYTPTPDVQRIWTNARNKIVALRVKTIWQWIKKVLLYPCCLWSGHKLVGSSLDLNASNLGQKSILIRDMSGPINYFFIPRPAPVVWKSQAVGPAKCYFAIWLIFMTPTKVW